METEVKKHPDFPQWIQGEEGKGCMRWPVSEPTYLKNRLFWAFDAGRNCVWEQYMNQKSELASLREQLKHKEEERIPLLLEFKKWYDKLTPAQKCTVWPPSGSGAGTGLYNKQDEDLVDEFVKRQARQIKEKLLESETRIQGGE